MGSVQHSETGRQNKPTNYPRDVAEAALAHTIPDAVERAYRRGDLFEKRSRLMEDWANYCVTVIKKAI